MYELLRNKNTSSITTSSPRITKAVPNNKITSETPPAISPVYLEGDCFAEPLDVEPPPLVAISVNSMGRKMMQLAQAISSDDYFDEHDSSDTDHIKHNIGSNDIAQISKKRKIENNEQNTLATSSSSSMPIITKVSSSSELLSYQRRRDKILLTQNNNMLKLMKALLQNQGVSVPFDVTVDLSQL